MLKGLKILNQNNIIRKVGSKIKNLPQNIKIKKVISSLNKQQNFKKISLKRKSHPRIVVSLTSYKKRFNTLDICVKSILNQTLQPDRLILYLSKEEKYEDIPESVKKLEKYGLEIKFVEYDLKPHKKYYYAMQEFPNDIIITVDDDVIYDKHLIEYLWITHLKFKRSIIATRAHQITFTANGKINLYNNWNWTSKIEETPRMDLMPTGVGGILYPPHVLRKDLLNNKEKIEKYIKVDDLWLKNVEVLSNVSTVLCKKSTVLEKRRIGIPNTQDTALMNVNVFENNNDKALEELDKEYNLSRKILSRVS